MYVPGKLQSFATTAENYTFCVEVLKGSPVGFAPLLDQLCQYITGVAGLDVGGLNVDVSFLFVISFVLFANTLGLTR